SEPETAQCLGRSELVREAACLKNPSAFLANKLPPTFERGEPETAQCLGRSELVREAACLKNRVSLSRQQVASYL
ncbi:hypothetical protein, partial [Pseudomonas folii]|uniref:hypothetical protein n=1 Tax=Pseudomonas folii TaxID=2762593 RepID=UPI001BE41B82